MRRAAVLIMVFLLTISYSIHLRAMEELPQDTLQDELQDEEPATEHPKTIEYPEDPTKEPELVAEAAIVMDASTGQVLYDKHAEIGKYPASITKIMTVALALEHGLNLDETVEISENAVWGVDRDSSLIGLDVGERVTLGDLVYATMVKSDNTCAYALAEYVSGSIEEFAKLMNQKAEELGCKHTHFVTPNGLPDEDHYTTAYDMALITRYALSNDTFREIAGTLSYTVPATNKTKETRPLWNGNKMINPGDLNYYEYCEGGKTGYTIASKNTLVTFAKKEDLELICVIMDCDGSAYTYTDSRALYNYCYRNYTYFYPLSDFYFHSAKDERSQPNVLLDNYYTSLLHDMVDLNVDNGYALLISRFLDTTLIRHEITLFDEPEGNVLGQIDFFYEDQLLGSTPITTTMPRLSSRIDTGEEPAEQPSLLKRAGRILIRVLIAIAALLLLFLLFILVSNAIRNARFHRRDRRYQYRRRSRKHRKDDYHW